MEYVKVYKFGLSSLVGRVGNALEQELAQLRPDGRAEHALSPGAYVPAKPGLVSHLAGAEPGGNDNEPVASTATPPF